MKELIQSAKDKAAREFGYTNFTELQSRCGFLNTDRLGRATVHKAALKQLLKVTDKAIELSIEAERERLLEARSVLEKIQVAAELAIHGGSNNLYHFCELVLLNTRPLLEKENGK